MIAVFQYLKGWKEEEERRKSTYSPKHLRAEQIGGRSLNRDPT